MNRRSACLLTTLIPFILQAAPSFGAAVTNSDGVSEQVGIDVPKTQQDGGQLKEITITARKREERLLDVPITETVISRQSLEQFGTNDILSLASRVPGLELGDQLGVFGPTISIRGMSTTVQDPSVDQDVSLNVDGLQLSQAFAFNSALFDLDQVQVLKGPQALFFGKNSPAGVIAIRTADPTDKTELIVRTGYESESQEKLVEAVMSGPVSPAWKLRLAAQYSTNNGYFNNPDVAPQGYGTRTPTTTALGAEENEMLRGTALFNPIDLPYDARLKLNYTHDLSNYAGGEQALANCPGGAVSFTGLPLFDPNEDCRLDRNVYISWYDPKYWPYIGHDGIPYIASHQEFGTLTQNLHLGEITLTSVTGYYDYQQAALINGNEGSGAITIGVNNNFSDRELTQELRLASYFRGPLNFLVGGFYQDAGLMNHPRIYLNETLGLPPVDADVIHHVDIKSVSTFGQLLWNITRQVELSAGARWTDETRNHEQFNTSALGIATLGVPVGPTTLLDPHLHATNTSPEVTLTYKPAADLTFWGSYKRGFKSGSFDTSVYYNSTTPSSFGDEQVAGPEAGIKALMLDRHLSLDLSVYDYLYKGLQVAADQTGTATVGSIVTLNAATARSSGLDFDVNYAPPRIDGLTLDAAGSWNVARYINFPNAPCMNNQTIAEGCDQLYSAATGAYTAQDLSGQRLVRAPRWSGTVGADYNVAVSRGLTLTLGGSVESQSWYYTNILDLPRATSSLAPTKSNFIQSGFYKLNVNVSLAGVDDAWQLSVIGADLNDKITTSACTNGGQNGGIVFGGQVSGELQGGPAGDDYALCAPQPGRTVWLRLTLLPLAFRSN